MHNFMQRCCFKILCNKMHLIHAIGPQTHVLGCFRSFRYRMKFGAKWAELVQLMHKFVQQCRIEFFATNSPDTPHWRPNSSLGSFRTVPLVHKLRCKTGQAGVINAQNRATKSHQNFLQRTHPIHPIGPHTHILGRFRPFRDSTNFGAKQGRSGAINAQVSCNEVTSEFFATKAPDPHHWTPKLMYWSVSDSFVTYKLRCKSGRTRLLMHKFVQQYRVEIFRTERIRSTRLDFKLLFWGISDHFITTRTSVQNGAN
jgi:hypothetical protein